MKFLVTDDDQCYVSKAFQNFCRDYQKGRSIGKWTLAAYAHNQNPAEREMRTLVEFAVSMLSDSGLPPSFAIDAIQCACNSKNAVFTPVFFNEEHRHHPPHRWMLEVNAHVNTQARFGCRTIVAEPKERRANKLTADYSKSWKGFNLGPQHNMMAFKVHRPMQSPTAVFDRYHVIHDSSIVYGDFMGAAFQKAVRGVQMAREYFDAEVENYMEPTQRSW